MENRCVIILNHTLPSGKAANAAAVMALTLGQRYPHFVGKPLCDAQGRAFPGLITSGVPVLAASDEQLAALYARCEEQQLDRILFPAAGQQTTDYAALTAVVRETEATRWPLCGMAVVAEKKALRKLTAALTLFA